jgi:hypothetical protein
VLLTFGISGVGQSEAGSVAHCRTTLLFLSTLKLARNLAFASWISFPCAPRTGVVRQLARFPKSAL